MGHFFDAPCETRRLVKGPSRHFGAHLVWGLPDARKETTHRFVYLRSKPIAFKNDVGLSKIVFLRSSSHWPELWCA